MGREMGGSFKRERTYVYLFMLRFDRIQNSVKQLSFNQKNKLIFKRKKERTHTHTQSESGEEKVVKLGQTFALKMTHTRSIMWSGPALWDALCTKQIGEHTGPKSQ